MTEENGEQLVSIVHCSPARNKDIDIYLEEPISREEALRGAWSKCKAIRGGMCALTGMVCRTDGLSIRES